MRISWKKAWAGDMLSVWAGSDPDRQNTVACPSEAFAAAYDHRLLPINAETLCNRS